MEIVKPRTDSAGPRAVIHSLIAKAKHGATPETVAAAAILAGTAQQTIMPATELVAREYLAPLREAEIESLVLGCTHYPLLKPLLSRVLGPSVRLIDSAEETARAVAEQLSRDGLIAPPGNAVSHRFAVSDDEVRFRSVGSRFIGEKLSAAEVVALG